MNSENVLAGESREYLDLTAIITIIIVILVWGFNHTAIKYSNQGVPRSSPPHCAPSLLRSAALSIA